jgi:hypothetical protein
MHPCRPKGLDQIINSPIDANTGEESGQSDEDQKYERLLKEQAIIEDTPQFFEPFEIDLEGKKKCHQDRHWDQIKE